MSLAIAEGESDDEMSGDEEYADYYNTDECSDEVGDFSNIDPETFPYTCLSLEDVEKLLNESVEILSTKLSITPALAKLLLHINNWNLDPVIVKCQRNMEEMLIAAHVKAPHTVPSTLQPTVCPVCVVKYHREQFSNLACGHQFCKDCWTMHFEVQVSQGVSTGIQCMERDCDIIAPEDFVLSLLTRPSVRKKYLRFAFADYVKSHPQLRFCPGANCTTLVQAGESLAKRAICHNCKTVFCFKCGTDYHSPTDCDTIKQWLTKCADDSETANYISAHTRDCPKCHICIEKNGGCNHMQCYNCKHDFCWMCLGDWKAHGSEYYECSRYKENPNIAQESLHVKAREALKKYLFYYERWENHSKSLKLEEATLETIKERINEKVMGGSGTWIDWQYLTTAAGFLAKCRYTLQYTYPYAYYLQPGPRKSLFEYQQAQLELEIEDLSWKIERAESTDRGDLENQMDIAEKRRITLLKDFIDV